MARKLGGISDVAIEAEEYLCNNELYLVDKETLIAAMDNDIPTDTFLRNCVMYQWEETNRELSAHYESTDQWPPFEEPDSSRFNDEIPF